MWLVLSYDIPSGNAKQYRMFRKQLLQAGFSFPQKSLCWRWVHSSGKADSIQKRICAAFTAPGRLLFWRMPDSVFDAGVCMEDLQEKKMPDTPSPWIVV